MPALISAKAGGESRRRKFCPNMLALGCHRHADRSGSGRRTQSFHVDARLPCNRRASYRSTMSAQKRRGETASATPPRRVTFPISLPRLEGRPDKLRRKVARARRSLSTCARALSALASVIFSCTLVHCVYDKVTKASALSARAQVGKLRRARATFLRSVCVPNSSHGV